MRFLFFHPVSFLRSTLSLTAMLVKLATATGITSYSQGDTLYVWAMSGLTLRETPDLKGNKLNAAPYGSIVVAQDWKFFNDENKIQVEAAPGHKSGQTVSPPVILQGRFAPVLFQGEKGYVFDGYLSKFPPPQYKIGEFGEHKNWRCFEIMDAYGAREFGLKSQKIVRESGDMYGTVKSVFGNGMVIDRWCGKGETGRIILPDLSLEEGFLFFSLFENYEQQVRRPSSDPQDYPWQYSGKSGSLMTNSITMRFGDAACGFTIRWLPLEQTVIITYECSC